MIEMNAERKFQLALKEVEILQTRYDKYELMIMQNRQLAVAVVSGILGYSLSSGKWSLAIAGVVAVLFLFGIEVALDKKFLAQLRARNRLLRSAVNEGGIDNVYLLDFFNSRERAGKKTFVMGNWDRWMLYLGLLLAPIVTCLLTKFSIGI